ncbi:MAG: hypothetical protein IPL61_21965 [Myxococcales bacterium]|nr:hypothetical protein [Myxococcales bacterium]
MTPPAPAQPAQPEILVATDLSARRWALRASFAQALAHGARLVVSRAGRRRRGRDRGLGTIAPVRTTIARAIGGGGDDRAAVDALVLTGERAGRSSRRSPARARPR